jgi:hypothetical protein
LSPADSLFGNTGREAAAQKKILAGSRLPDFEPFFRPLTQRVGLARGHT